VRKDEKPAHLDHRVDAIPHSGYRDRQCYFYYRGRGARTPSCRDTIPEPVPAAIDRSACSHASSKIDRTRSFPWSSNLSSACWNHGKRVCSPEGGSRDADVVNIPRLEVPKAASPRRDPSSPAAGCTKSHRTKPIGEACHWPYSFNPNSTGDAIRASRRLPVVADMQQDTVETFLAVLLRLAMLPPQKKENPNRGVGP